MRLLPACTHLRILEGRLMWPAESEEVGHMADVLIVYGTSEGQTAKIAEVIADVIRDLGHKADAVDIKTLSETLPRGYDGLIIGASIHMGKHDKHVVEFVRNNHDTLDRVPSAFFSVSLAAHGDTEEAEGYVAQFEAETGWHPDGIALFSGALLYTSYGFMKRHLMKKIAGDKPGHLGLDTSRDYVYTEWDAVKRFAEHFADRLEPASA
jgi:menaquinone-dependent protoporphyrinogen oxidase